MITRLALYLRRAYVRAKIRWTLQDVACTQASIEALPVVLSIYEARLRALRADEVMLDIELGA